MAGDDGQEKTEQPTGKRLADAHKRGQVPRSREMGTLFVLLSGVLALWAFAKPLGEAMKKVMQMSFTLTKDQVFAEDEMRRLFAFNIDVVAIPLLSICVIVFVAAFIGNVAIGGFNFSQKAMTPTFSKLNPLSGIKRMFSLNSLVELIKSILKVSFISFFCYSMLSGKVNQIFALSFSDPLVAIYHAISLLFHFMLVIVLAMLPIVLIDAPYQLWHYKQQLRMTKQEVKDEFKEQEGNPQIKSKIRHMQFEMAARRMMGNVPKADVVVTNPTHYAVALSYDPEGSLAPVVVAKGVDEIAAKIKEIAYEYDVPVLALPPLARSLYYTTDLDREIPRGLFKAVAQVLAFVLGMKNFKEGKGRRPRDLDPNLPIPDELRF